MDIILSPPLAFLIYLSLTIVLLWVGRILAGPQKSNSVKSSIYGSGEVAPTTSAAPGYRPFFLVAFFFGILHLGMLVLGSSGFNLVSGIYSFGLALALIALILG